MGELTFLLHWLEPRQNNSILALQDCLFFLLCFYLIFQQVHLEGVTGNVQFDKDGKRNGFEMEVLNLRNNSFEKVCP